jgi:ABC-2 type transport system ATP-binding protein
MRREPKILESSNKMGTIFKIEDSSELGSETRIPAVKVTNLVKAYGKRTGVASSVEIRGYLSTIRGKVKGAITALDRVNLTVREGEVFGLLGPNGAGKTTLIKILSTLVLPDSGQALVYGVDVARHPRAALRYVQTVLSQTNGFEFRLSGRRNLEFYSALYGIKSEEAKKRIDRLLAFSGLADQADSSFQKYSTGMARKLLVCRALLTDASLLIFDEPTSALDPRSAFEFRRFIQDDVVKNERKTAFIATHNIHEAQQICDRIALIENGKIIAVGTPAEIRTMVSDSVNITVILEGHIERPLANAASQVAKVKGLLTCESQNRLGNTVLQVTGEKEMDYNGLFDVLLKNKIRILSLEATEPSLEDAFLSLVK